MKDKIKCAVIDVMLLGNDVEIFWNHIWECWSLTHGNQAITPILFSWQHDKEPTIMEALTLKECLEIIDRHWHDRIVTHTDEWGAA